jgi:hypothetical protein
VYFVTSVEEERADAALDGMFKFLAAQENDTIRERTIRQVKFFSTSVWDLRIRIPLDSESVS